MVSTWLERTAQLYSCRAHPTLPFLTLLCSDCCVFQEFSLQRIDSLVDDRVNILGFSIFNQSHAFFQEFAQSLNQSWQENCDHVPFTGPAVSAHQAPPWCPFAATHAPSVRQTPLDSSLLRAQLKKRL